MSTIVLLVAIFVVGYAVGYGHRSMISAYRRKQSRNWMVRYWHNP